MTLEDFIKKCNEWNLRIQSIDDGPNWGVTAEELVEIFQKYDDKDSFVKEDIRFK